MRDEEVLPCLGDFEASGLAPDSYPIQVAWSLPNSNIAKRLIRREPGWEQWDEAAEELHRISILDLECQGIPAAEVAREMNRDLAGNTLYFDGGDFDRQWLSLLFDAAGTRPSFKFGDFGALLARTGRVDGAHRVVAEALAGRDIGDARRHDAGNDVWEMQRVYFWIREGTHDLP